MKMARAATAVFFLLLSQLAFSLAITGMVTEFPLNQEISLAAAQDDCDRKSYVIDVGLSETIDIGQGPAAGAECTAEDYFNNILSQGDPRPHFEAVSAESKIEASYLGNFIFTEGQTIKLDLTLKNTQTSPSPKDAVLRASDLQGNSLALIREYPVGAVPAQQQTTVRVSFTPSKDSGVVFLAGIDFGLFQLAYFTYTVAGLGEKPRDVPPAFHSAPPSIQGMAEKGLIIELPLEQFQETAEEIFGEGVETVFEGRLPEENWEGEGEAPTFHGAQVGDQWQIIDDGALAEVEGFSRQFNEKLAGKNLSGRTGLNKMGRAITGKGDGVVVCGEGREKCSAYQKTFDSHVALSSDEFLTNNLQEDAALTNGPYAVASILGFYFFKLISFLFGWL